MATINCKGPILLAQKQYVQEISDYVLHVADETAKITADMVKTIDTLIATDMKEDINNILESYVGSKRIVLWVPVDIDPRKWVVQFIEILVSKPYATPEDLANDMKEHLINFFAQSCKAILTVVDEQRSVTYNKLQKVMAEDQKEAS